MAHHGHHGGLKGALIADEISLGNHRFQPIGIRVLGRDDIA